MCICPELRGKGYGLALLKAAEALTLLVGEKEVYLHVRVQVQTAASQPHETDERRITHHAALSPPTHFPDVQDKPAAALYAKGGYRRVAGDSFLVRLVGLDQRTLLWRQIAD